MKVIEVRRFNFIVGTTLIYSGLFPTSKGFKNWLALKKAIWDKKIYICRKYGIPIPYIKVERAIKDVK